MKLHQWNFLSSVIVLYVEIMSIHMESINDIFHLAFGGKSRLPNRNGPESRIKEIKTVQKVCITEQCKKAAEYVSRNMNINALPCQNFYKFACGNYHKWHPIPDYIDRMNPFRERQDVLLQESADILMTRAYENNNSPSIRKAREMFESCMNEEAAERLGDLPIPIELNTLGLPIEPPFYGSVNQSFNLSRLLAKMHRHAVFGLFLFDTTVFTDEYNMTKNYLSFNYTPHVIRFETLDEPNEEIIQNHQNFNRRTSYVEVNVQREALIEYMTKVIKYVYENISGKFRNVKSSIAKEVAEVADFLIAVEETKNVESSYTEAYFATPTYTTIPNLQKITDDIFRNGNEETKINWLDYVETLLEDIYDDTRQSFEKEETVIVKHMEQWQSVIRLVSKISENVMVRAIWWMTVEPLTSYGTQALREIRKEFHKQIKKPKRYIREHRCINVVRRDFPFVVGHILLKQTKNPEKMRENVIEMVDNINKAFEDTIKHNYWLDISTKMAILNKLQSIGKVISYQNWMLEVENLEIIYGKFDVYPNSLYLSRKNIKKLAREEKLKILRMDNDYSKGKYVHLVLEYFGSTRGPSDPTQVNGGYYPFFNTIDIPISILGQPFYDLGLDSLNYGALGVILGHEMGHAFDNFGRNFNSKGERVQWWKKKSKQIYEKFETCFIDEYSKFNFPVLNKSVDGRLTLGENIADIIGFTQALKAYRQLATKTEDLLLPGLELYSHEKLFTLAFANVFCDNVELGFREWQLNSDEHSPSPARVNGVARNSEDFARIWNCSQNSYMNPKEKCVLW